MTLMNKKSKIIMSIFKDRKNQLEFVATNWEVIKMSFQSFLLQKKNQLIILKQLLK